MKEREEYAVAVVLWCFLLWLPIVWEPGGLISVAWIGAGFWWTLKSTSLGIFPDLAFIVTWPYYVWHEL